MRAPALIGLMRPGNAVMAGLGAVLGYLCLYPAGSGPFPRIGAVLGFAAMALLAAAGNVHNDVLDVKTDSVNRPDRALPSGRVSIRRAGMLALALYAFAAAAAYAAGPAQGLLALVMCLLLCAYNLRLKAMPGWGNLAVSALCAAAVYFPEFPGPPLRTGWPALFAFLATLARELAKDAEDAAGDRLAGRDTFPLRYGPGATRITHCGLAVLTGLLLPAPIFLSHYRPAYAFAAGSMCLPLLLFILTSACRTEPDWKKIQRLWKWTMLAGMAAILAGVT